MEIEYISNSENKSLNLIKLSSKNLFAYIGGLILHHSHPCCPNQAETLKQHRQLSMFVRRTIENSDEAGIRLSKTYQSFVAAAGDHRELSFIEKDMKNYITREVRNVPELDNDKEFEKSNAIIFSVWIFMCFASLITLRTLTLFGAVCYDSQLFEDRHLWILIYLDHHFWVGMRNKQSSESMHAFFNKEQREREFDAADFYTVIPCATKSSIEAQFHHLHFRWDAEHDLTIKKIFDHRMGRRLKQMLNDVRQGQDHRTTWLQLDIMMALYVHWETDEGFQHRCLTNRANRPRKSSKYTGSLATFMKTKVRLSKSLDPEATLTETFKYTHALKENKETFADQQEDATDGSAASVVDPDVVWCKTALAPYKNCVYGVGWFFTSSLCTSTLREILCRYSLSALSFEQVDKVAPRYILERWSKNVKRRHTYIKRSHNEPLLEPRSRRFDDLVFR
ncbi:hypothetical protein Ahy_B01g052331 [Arachis hypogaea]|uniref:Uncharacterized protein n=1 Tax=Arachis hypogaea TaxID=3818 RepID=A0A445AP60_ARAHY|nr:hypothetical protein Ahy_B01g052331 [Arachis hypogaea]